LAQQVISRKVKLTVLQGKTDGIGAKNRQFYLTKGYVWHSLPAIKK